MSVRRNKRPDLVRMATVSRPSLARRRTLSAEHPRICPASWGVTYSLVADDVSMTGDQDTDGGPGMGAGNCSTGVRFHELWGSSKNRFRSPWKLLGPSKFPLTTTQAVG